MYNGPLSVTNKITGERRGHIVLIGINRPYIHTESIRKPIADLRPHTTNTNTIRRYSLQFCSDTATISPEASTSTPFRR